MAYPNGSSLQSNHNFTDSHTGDNGVGNETLIIREPHIPPEPVTEKVIQVLTNID